MEHTPGPWKAEFDSEAPDRGKVYVEGPNGWKSEPIAACDFDQDIGQNEANARLISAAPDLLSALRLAREYMSLCLGSTYEGDDPYPIIDAAIAMAEA